MTSKPPLEREIESDGDDIARAEGWLPFKFERVGRGWPDKIYLGPDNDHFIAEWKRPGEKPRKQQQARIDKLRAMGHEVLVLDNTNDLLQRLRR